jgi:hypothetical protein
MTTLFRLTVAVGVLGLAACSDLSPLAGEELDVKFSFEEESNHTADTREPCVDNEKPGIVEKDISGDIPPAIKDLGGKIKEITVDSWKVSSTITGDETATVGYSEYGLYLGDDTLIVNSDVAGCDPKQVLITDVPAANVCLALLKDYVNNNVSAADLMKSALENGVVKGGGAGVCEGMTFTASYKISVDLTVLMEE